MAEQQSPGEPFEISKMEVWWTWEKVRDNKGAAGIDRQSIADFEQDAQNNLYKIWNRLSSGSYFPRRSWRWRSPKPEAPERQGCRRRGLFAHWRWATSLTTDW